MNVNASQFVDLRMLSSEKKNIDRQIAAISVVAMVLLLLVGIVGILNHVTYFSMSMLDWIVLALATIFILEATFIPQIEKAGSQLQSSTGVLAGGGSVTTINVLAIGPVVTAFYIAVIVHAAGDGIMAGVIQDGRIANGMRHSALMLIIGFVFMHILLGV